MPDQPLPSHPSFRIRPGGTSHQVLGHGGTVIGLIEVTSDFRGRASRDAGPLRCTALAAAEDVAHLHIALHGGPSGAQEPYTDADDAHRALAHVPPQVNDIVDSAARAYLFGALRQPHVAAIAGRRTGYDRPREPRDHLTAGSRRTARLLHHLVLAPARSLLSEAEGEARKWTAFPIARLASLTAQARARLAARHTASRQKWTPVPPSPYNIYIEFSTNHPMSPDSYAALFIALQKVNGGVGPSASGKPSVRITVTANDLAEACDTGLRIAAEALMECSITGVPEHVSATLSL